MYIPTRLTVRISRRHAAVVFNRFNRVSVREDLEEKKFLFFPPITNVSTRTY